MAWPKLLVFVRHAESEGNVLSSDERAHFDSSTHLYNLTPCGEKQAKATGDYLRERFGDFDVYYQSYYSRTKQTLDLMYPGAHVYEDSRLAEAQRGIWHTMTKAEIEAAYPGELVRKEREGLYHYRPWGGENWPDIELRIHSFLGTLSRDYGGKKVLCAVHGHWLILFQKLIHHFSVDEAVRRYKEAGFENASVTIYEGAEMPGPTSGPGPEGKSRLVLKEENVVPWEGKI